MHFTNFLTLGLVALVSATPMVAKRDFNTIVTDFASIETKLSALDVKIQAYTGTLAQTLSLALDIQSLQDLAEDTTDHVTANGALTLAQSATLNTAGEKTVVHLETMLDSLKPKINLLKPYKNLALPALEEVKGVSDGLFGALAAAVESSYLDELQALQARINVGYQEVIDLLTAA